MGSDLKPIKFDRLRSIYARTGKALFEAHAVIGVPVSKRNEKHIQHVRYAPMDQLDFLQAETVATLTEGLVEVLRVIAADHPDALEHAIRVTEQVGKDLSP